MHKNFDAFEKGPANFVPLSPVSFLNRIAGVFADRRAVVYGNRSYTWSEVRTRCRAVAASLNARGLGLGDTVTVLAPNIPEMFELHYAVPMSGAVLNTVNVRLEPETVAYIIDHSDCKLMIVDSAFAGLVRAAFDILGRSVPVIDIIDAQGPGGDPFGDADYEQLATSGLDLDGDGLPQDEWQALALNYTSGTSGRPKGVVYHHRGAYLMAMGTLPSWEVTQHPVYLSVVPMFHCNGWNHPWAMAVVAATMVFVRDVDPAKIFAAMASERVTHLGAAPIVLAMLADAAEKPAEPFDPPVNVMTAGAPPPPAILEKSRALGFNVTQVYGLTETYGHVTQCVWREEWADLGDRALSRVQARQGVAMPMMEGAVVIDRDTGLEVPADGQTQGEIALRGNTVMKGYYKNKEATDEAFAGGWFWSGDAAVVHDYGYVEIRDRLKDVIISGGENISSVELEGVLYRHPAVAAAAVVARPDDKWGEVPCACIELRAGQTATAEEMDAFCREHLAGFKRPKHFVFTELPKTATGKIQKFKLRDLV